MGFFRRALQNLIVHLHSALDPGWNSKFLRLTHLDDGTVWTNVSAAKIGTDADPFHLVGPTYYVAHPGGTFSVADPQPVLKPKPNFTDGDVSQLKFLLARAPMVKAPRTALKASVIESNFVYVHPITFAKFGQILPGHSRWVLTSLMPQGCIILSSEQHAVLPGFEKRAGL